MPIFIDIALVMLLGAVDTVMLSRYSDDAVAAVALTTSSSPLSSSSSSLCQWVRPSSAHSILVHRYANASSR